MDFGWYREDVAIAIETDAIMVYVWLGFCHREDIQRQKQLDQRT